MGLSRSKLALIGGCLLELFVSYSCVWGCLCPYFTNYFRYHGNPDLKMQ